MLVRCVHISPDTCCSHTNTNMWVIFLASYRKLNFHHMTYKICSKQTQPSTRSQAVARIAYYCLTADYLVISDCG